ncbi:hypothetical protein CQW23_24251 [Capsicum baccatum]|uniref:Uncharacterized protein n=1 Tax=Capsicum baccatum TaxID=33114 RepID=A0A2G2VUA8_CAPBA|nr:hypothetical protein CQW23_24251 [Capsicum baccatum]
MSFTNPEQNDKINLGVRYMGLNSEQNDGCTKAWGKQKTKTWGHPDVFDISGVHTNVGSGWGYRYNWYAPNDPQKNAMSQLHNGGFPSPAAVSPARKNVRDWSARAASAHPKNTSPVADDDKASEHDIEDNELKEHDADDDKTKPKHSPKQKELQQLMENINHAIAALSRLINVMGFMECPEILALEFYCLLIDIAL